MARISATATAPLFFYFAPTRRAPPALVRASGAVALKVAKVPSTGQILLQNFSEEGTVVAV